MPLSNAIALTVGTLWDGRLKLWAQVNDGFMSREMITVDQRLVWGHWSPFPVAAQVQAMPSAIPSPDLSLSVYCNGVTAPPAIPGKVPGPGTPSILFQAQDQAGTYGAWQPMAGSAGLVLLGGAVMGPQVVVPTTAGNYLAPAQLWAVDASGGVQTASTSNTGSWSSWSSFAPGLPPGAVVLWAQIGPNWVGEGWDPGPSLFAATDISHVPASPQPYLQLFWSEVTWPSTPDPYAPNQTLILNWAPWQPFSPALDPSTGGVASLAAGSSNFQQGDTTYQGITQLFASDAAGNLWTIWQEAPPTPNPPASVGWPASWQSFPLPGGNRVAHLYPGTLDYSPPSLQRYALALAQTTAGQLELFAIDENADVWRTWQRGTLTSSPWAPWERF